MGANGDRFEINLFLFADYTKLGTDASGKDV